MTNGTTSHLLLRKLLPVRSARPSSVQPQTLRGLPHGGASRATSATGRGTEAPGAAPRPPARDGASRPQMRDGRARWLWGVPTPAKHLRGSPAHNVCVSPGSLSRRTFLDFKKHICERALSQQRALASSRVTHEMWWPRHTRAAITVTHELP